MEDSYCLYTTNTPIPGVREDLNEFINQFTDAASPRFADFVKLWQQKEFIHIIYGRQTQHCLRDVMEAIFYNLLIVILDVNAAKISKICALYLLYAFYGRQPIQKQARIQVNVLVWSEILNLIDCLREEEQWDAYYIFRKLCVTSAFRFSAALEELYPGAPLNKRSDIVLPIGSSFLSNADRRRQIKKPQPQAMPVTNIVPNRFKELPESFKKNWSAINTAIVKYVDAKNALQINDLSQQPSSSQSDSNNDEKSLMGLSLITIPESLKNLSTRLDEFGLNTQSVFENNEHPLNSEINLQTSPNRESKQEEPSGTQVDELNDIGNRRKRLRESKKWTQHQINLDSKDSS